jgi:hypothetical protein
MIQIITKNDEIFSDVLNMSWWYHFNYIEKLLVVWFHKKYVVEVSHSNNHKCVEKNICWKMNVIWKTTKIMLEAFVSEFILYVY